MKRTKRSPACKALAKRKFKVWPSAYASGYGVRCTKAGGPGKMGKKRKKKKQWVRRVTLKERLCMLLRQSKKLKRKKRNQPVKRRNNA